MSGRRYIRKTETHTLPTPDGKVVELARRRAPATVFKKGDPKPERAFGFKPGQSGNPKGRPKIPAEFTDLMRKFSVDAAYKLYEWMMRDDPKTGPQIAQYIINRAYGTPTQITEVSGANGAPLNPPGVTITFVRPEPAPSPQTIDG